MTPQAAPTPDLPSPALDGGAPASTFTWSVPALLSLGLMAGCGGSSDARQRRSSAVVENQPRVGAMTVGQHLHLGARVRGSQQTAVHWFIAEAGPASVTPDGRFASSSPGTYFVRSRLVAAPGVGDITQITVYPKPAIRVLRADQDGQVAEGHFNDHQRPDS